MKRALAGAAAAATLALGACQTVPERMERMSDAEIDPRTQVRHQLSALPPPGQRVAVAVYGFEDQTGQFKPSDTGQTLSRAVTQGASSILVKALRDAGDRTWFDVVERENLNHLLNERQIITQMRQQYLGEDLVNPQALPPLMFAGVLLEGGIISYDTNTRTGGLGARYLGIGGHTMYREDTVTVYLRAVSTRTGEVLSTVTTQQRVASVGIAANAFRFVSFQELFEFDSGITVNQPTQLAVQQAIEKAVYALVVDGAMNGVWGFADPVAGGQVIDSYQAVLSGIWPADALADRPDLAQADPEMIRPAAAPADAAAQINQAALAQILGAAASQ